MRRISIKNKSGLLIPSLLGVLVVFAILNSTILYSFQVNQEMEIIELSKQQVITNLSRESLQVSQIAELEVEHIVDRIDLLTRDPIVKQQDYDGVPFLLQSTQSTTSDLTSSYFILDADGSIIYATDDQMDTNSIRENISEYQKATKENLEPKVYTVNSIQNTVPVGGIYVTLPMINEGTGIFDGVIGATLRADILVRKISSDLGLIGESHLDLTDSNGNLIYSSRVPESVGEHIASSAYLQSNSRDFEIEHYINSIDKANSGWTGFFELNNMDESGPEQGTIVSYSPVNIDEEIVLLAFVSSPTNVEGVITDVLVAERSYAVFVVFSILTVLGFFAVVIIIINKKLRNLVKIRTNELEKVNEELKHKDRLKDEFLSIASHELRSPIQPILGFAGLAKKRNIDDDEAWDGVLRHSRRLQEVANDILDSSRIESGELTYVMEKFEINEVILDAINSAKVNLNGSASIESKLCKDVEIEGDRARIIQVLSNIIGNAVKFTRKGSIKVESHAFPERNRVEIKISDTGGGIPNDILPHLFGKFITKSVGGENQHGTGLGLFISKAIVIAHKGEIFAYNNDEGGATFTILLPMVSSYQTMKISKHDI
ncbi:MAG: ATP-binding protein [Nitrososphaerales archaeon]